jgi:hypothetical protein
MLHAPAIEDAIDYNRQSLGPDPLHDLVAVDEASRVFEKMA